MQMEKHNNLTITLSSSGFKLKSMVMYGFAFCSEVSMKLAHERLKKNSY